MMIVSENPTPLKAFIPNFLGDSKPEYYVHTF
jgi:hypothetical protein